MKDIIPILKVLLKSKANPLLMILQIAVTYTVIVNAIFMIYQKELKITTEIGVDEQNSFYTLTNLQGKPDELPAKLESELHRLQSMGGVEAITPMTGLPLEGWGRTTRIYSDIDEKNKVSAAGYFGVDRHALDALSLELIAGENFTSEDEQVTFLEGDSKFSNIIITQALAEDIDSENWQNALGQSLYFSGSEHKVKGIVDKIQNGWSSWSKAEHTIISPVSEAYESVRYFIKAESGSRDKVMRAVNDYLLSIPGKKIERSETIEALKRRYYEQDIATNKLLFAVCITLALVTCFGIFGQARYNVNRRKKQIGTRRALGASRVHILRYFLVENAIISVLGIALGSILAIALSSQFITFLSIDAVPISFLTGGALVVFLLGQFAVAYPAAQAASVSPAIVTRAA